MSKESVRIVQQLKHQYGDMDGLTRLEKSHYYATLVISKFIFKFSGGLHFRKGHYCSFCNKIYPPNFEIECEKELLSCSVCSKFEHKKCLESNGIPFDYSHSTRNKG
jgi:hypothetical protein